MDECRNRAAGSLEWKDGESERERFEKWRNSLPLAHRITFQTDAFHLEGWQGRQPEIDALKAEVAHWKANHANMVNRSRVLIDRPDLPLERVEAFKQLETLTAENEKLRSALAKRFKIVAKVESIRKDVAVIRSIDGIPLTPHDFLYRPYSPEDVSHDTKGE